MKKIVSTLVSAALLACMMPVTTTAFAADLSACDFKVTADKTAVHPGDTVTFTLTVTPTGDLYGISAGFDIPDGLTFQSAALADGLKDSLSWDFLDPPAAAAELFFGGTTSKPYTAGTALVIGTYTCKAEANLTTGMVSLTSVAAGNADLDEIANVTSNTVTIKAPELKEISAKAATCKEPGNNLYYKCSCGDPSCDRVYKSDKKTKTTVEAETLPMTNNHTYAEVVDAKYLVSAATCVAKAKYTESCKVCGAKGTKTFESGTVDKTKHGDTELKNKKEATCSDKGYTGDEVCKLCGDTVKAGEDIPATGEHTGGKATCSKKAVCENCKKEYGDLNPNNHEDMTLTGKKDPTCTEPGSTGSGTCSACGKTVEAKELSALGHKGGTATCSAKAVCEVCKKEYGELDPKNHSGETEVRDAKAATETEDGYTGDTYCLGCGEITLKGTTIPKTGSETPSAPTTPTYPTYPTYPSNPSDSSKPSSSTPSSSSESTTSSSEPSSSGTTSSTPSSSSGNTSNSTPEAPGDANKPSSNPATGVTLAVIPVLLAAGAAVIIAKNKKR